MLSRVRTPYTRCWLWQTGTVLLFVPSSGRTALSSRKNILKQLVRYRDTSHPSSACSRSIQANGPLESQALREPRLLAGRVVRGFGRGARQLGFPTANLDTGAADVETALQALTPGVYAGYATVTPDEVHRHAEERMTLTWYRAAVNLGYVPTFGNKQPSIEAHLLHQFTADFYGHYMQLILLAYIRPERKFDSREALIQQIHSDIERAQEILDQLGFVPDDWWTTQHSL